MEENKLESNIDKETNNFLDFLEENELKNLIIISEILNNPNFDKNDFNK